MYDEIMEYLLVLNVSVRGKQHNIHKLIQNEALDNIRSAAYGVRCDNECGKLQVITKFIETSYLVLSIHIVNKYTELINLFTFQFLSTSGNDIPAVHTPNRLFATTILVPLYNDVYEMDDVQQCIDRLVD